MDFSTKICVICLGISIITLFTLLLSSFNSLEVNEYGLDYSSISKSIGKKPYSAGIHFLGVGHSFIKFPKTVLNLEYSNHQGADYGPIRSRTSDGLEVILEISFQYKLIYEDLFELYNNYRENYSNIFSHIAIHTLTENTTEYTAYNFFVDIQRIGVKMQEALNKQFKIYCYSTIEFFQLRSVDLPDEFEKAIQVSEVIKQNIQKAQAQKSRTLVELETLKMSAQFQKEITINYAKGDAQQVEQQGKAEADSIIIAQSMNTEFYGKLKRQLNLSNKELLRFIKSKAIRDYQGNQIAIAINSPDQE